VGRGPARTRYFWRQLTGTLGIVSRSPLDDARLTAMGLLAEVTSGLVTALSPQLGAHGLSTVEFEVLLRLGRSPESRLRMSDLAAQTSLSTSGVTRVVDRLERDRLVRREACPEDRRGYFAVLTEEGVARLSAVLPGHLALVEEWFTGRLDRASLVALTDALRVVRDAVRPGAVAGAGGSGRPAARSAPPARAAAPA
jgi:MarR family transcriptional regulator, 2-MHQ and catechol-resistance regulon repressor